MATTSGDIAALQKRLGDTPKEPKGLKQWTEMIRRVNAKRLKRYFDLIGKPSTKNYSKRNTTASKR